MTALIGLTTLHGAAPAAPFARQQPDSIEVVTTNERPPAQSIEGVNKPHFPWQADFPATTEIDGATVYAETTDQVAEVEWALSRFAEAGLDLPYIEAWMTNIDHCIKRDGNILYGLYRHGNSHPVVFSCGTPFVLLHELGHAWDTHALSDAHRDRFLAIREAKAWKADRWKDRGAEHLANVIAWGLSDQDTRPPRVSGTLPNDPASLGEAFTLVTGVEPLS